MKRYFFSALLFVVFLTFQSCSGANVTFKFDNLTNANASSVDELTDTKTDYTGIKLTEVYLAEDMDENQDNVGKTPMIYINPECNNDVESCDVEARDDVKHVVSDYFDFSQSTEDINAELNAQNRTIEPGTYKYVRMEMCKYVTKDDTYNILFKGVIDDGSGNTKEVSQSFSEAECNVTAEFDNPVTITSSDTVVVKLQYTVSDLFHYSTNETEVKNSGCLGNKVFNTEVNGTTYYYCWSFPMFHPCIELNGTEQNCKNTM